MPWYLSSQTRSFFRPLSMVHILTLVVLFFIILAGLFILGKSSMKSNRIFSIGYAIFICFVEIAYQSWLWFNGIFDIKSNLPLNICSATLILSSILLLTQNRYIFTLVYFWGIVGSFYALLFPSIIFNFPHFRYIEFFIAHGCIIFVILYTAIVQKLKVDFRSTVFAYLFTGIYFLFIVLINNFLDSNYLYLATKPNFTSFFDLLGEFPYYIFALYLALIPIFFALYFVFIFVELVCYYR